MRKTSIITTWLWGLAAILVAKFSALLVPVLTNLGNPLHGQTGTALTILVVCGVLALGGVVLQTMAWLGAVCDALCVGYRD